MSDPCSEDDLELTKASQSDIIFELGQDIVQTTFSFNDNKGGACW
jgi:hypothetical protein